jgi:hypothetical protein
MPPCYEGSSRNRSEPAIMDAHWPFLPLRLKLGGSAGAAPRSGPRASPVFRDLSWLRLLLHNESFRIQLLVVLDFRKRHAPLKSVFAAAIAQLI